MARGLKTSPAPGRGKSKPPKRIEPPPVPAALLERISDGFAAFDADMNYIYVNRRGAELLGRKPEDLIGKNYWAEYPEAKGTPFAQAYVRALKTRKPDVFEDYYAPWERWFENRVYPSRDGLSVFFTEITGRKRAEEALREAREKYQGIFENAVEGIFQSTPEGRFIAVNPAMARIYGYDSPAEMLALTDIGSQIHVRPERRAEFIAALEAQGFVEGSENENYRKDGSVIWTSTNARVVRDAQGKVLYYEGFVADITERKRTEMELQSERELSQTILENIPVMIALIDPAGRTRWVNKHWESVLGWSLEEAASRDILLEMYPDPQERERVLKFALTAAGHWGDFRTRAKDGREIDTSWANVLLSDGTSIGIGLDITGRKRAEEALRESEERYRLLVEKSPYAIGVHQDGKIVFANPEAARLFGASREGELTGKPIMELISPETRDAARERIGRMLAGERGLYPAEDRYLRLDGSIVPVEVTAAPFTHAGRPAVQVIALDITERRQAEVELRESRERLALAVRSANVGLWDWDLRTNKVHYSTEWKSQLGYEDSEVSDDFSEWESRVHPDDLERAKATISGYIENPYPNYQNEFRMRHKDGSYRWILAQASLAYNGRGKPVRMTGSHIDITGRKRAEDELRLSEERFSKAFRNSPDGLVISKRSSGEILEVNDAFLQILGYSREEVIGHSSLELSMFAHPEDRSRLIQLLRETGSGRDVEVGIRRKPGELRQASLSAEIIEIGGEACLLTIIQDITERKRAEETIRRDEEILRLFVEHSPAAIAMFDRDMRYIAFSRRYLVDYELGDQDLTGRSHYEVFPEIPERWKEIHRRCLTGAIEKAEEDPFPRLSGKMDWIRWEIRPWYEADGGIGGILLFSEVVTERKQAQEELRLSRDRLIELSRRLVETREREARSVGRELHDQFGQMLTAMRITLDLAREMPPEAAAKQIEKALALTDDLIARVSRLTLELRPPMLDDLGLIPALTWRVTHYEEETGIRVEFIHEGAEGRRFAGEIETTAYRIVQEAMTNAARHAGAKRIRLEVRAAPSPKGGGGIDVRIEDDGAGFDAGAALEKSRGLNGMRERAGLVGGSFEIESQKGGGTRIHIRLPLKEENP